MTSDRLFNPALDRAQRQLLEQVNEAGRQGKSLFVEVKPGQWALFTPQGVRWAKPDEVEALKKKHPPSLIH